MTVEDYLKNHTSKLVKTVNIIDTERYTCWHQFFDDGTVIKSVIKEVGGNCWDVSETIYEDTFLVQPT